MVIHERVNDPDKFPRVIHVREPRFRISYDAPDDTWLAAAPRVVQDGREEARLWTDPFRQIYLRVLDTSGTLQEPFDWIVNRLASSYQRDGMTVRLKEATLAGGPCTRLEIDEAADRRVDTFLFRRAGIIYQLTVTVSLYDPQLIERALAGLRIDGGA